MEKIKLVIWDLDETFWKGTLSEGGITTIEKNIKIVNTLVDRGIMNSICSKNDFQNTKQKLKEIGMWDSFIFPHISWSPKGEQIRSIITLMQLRSINVLFIDDNHSNIEEAKFYNKGLQTAEPDFLVELLKHSALKGKDDKHHTRLKQYRILEKKQKEKKNFSDNSAFLYASNITLSFIKDLKNNRTRLAELIERTNQLNFTKNRISNKDLDKLIEDNSLEKRLIHVKDRFGNYGIIGFYALNKKENTLIHFLFSCRTLNLGIEQYVYSKLHFPKLEIIGDIVSNLNKKDIPDWITEEETIPKSIEKANQTNKKGKEINVFFKGGCDLRQMLYYIKKSFNIQEEVNYVRENNQPIHYDHSDIILQTFYNKLPKEKELPFLDKNIFNTQLFKANYDVLIYSVLMDYTQEVYQHSSGFRIPFGGYLDITLEKNKKKILQSWSNRRFEGMDETFLECFKKEYTDTGQISPERFKENLRKIRGILPSHIPIVFLNGSEQQIENNREIGAKERHIEMNKALDDFIAKNTNCYLLDIRKLTCTPDALTNNIRHYKRIIYVNIAEELEELLSVIFGAKESSLCSWSIKRIINRNDILYRFLKRIPRKLKAKLKK